jgi:hypothetical protein
MSSKTCENKDKQIEYLEACLKNSKKEIEIHENEIRQKWKESKVASSTKLRLLESKLNDCLEIMKMLNDLNK